MIVTKTTGTYGAGQHSRDRRLGRSSRLVYAKRHVEGAFAAVSVFAVPRHFLGLAASSLRRGILNQRDRPAWRAHGGARAAWRGGSAADHWEPGLVHEPLPLEGPHAFGDEGLGRDRPTSPASNYRIATATSVSIGVTRLSSWTNSDSLPDGLFAHFRVPWRAYAEDTTPTRGTG